MNVPSYGTSGNPPQPRDIESQQPHRRPEVGNEPEAQLATQELSEDAPLLRRSETATSITDVVARIPSFTLAQMVKGGQNMRTQILKRDIVSAYLASRPKLVLGDAKANEKYLASLESFVYSNKGRFIEDMKKIWQDHLSATCANLTLTAIAYKVAVSALQGTAGMADAAKDAMVEAAAPFMSTQESAALGRNVAQEILPAGWLPVMFAAATSASANYAKTYVEENPAATAAVISSLISMISQFKIPLTDLFSAVLKATPFLRREGYIDEGRVYRLQFRILSADLEEIYPSPVLSADGRKAIKSALARINGFLAGMDRGKAKMYESARKELAEIIKVLSQQKSSHDVFQHGENGDPEIAKRIDESTEQLVQTWRDRELTDIANLTKLFMNRTRQHSVDPKNDPPTLVFHGENEMEKWLLAKSISKALGVELLEVHLKEVKQSSDNGGKIELLSAIDKKIAKINTLGAILFVHGLEDGDLDLVPNKNKLPIIYSTYLDGVESEYHPYAVHIPVQDHRNDLQNFLFEKLLDDVDEKYTKAKIEIACQGFIDHIIKALASNPRVPIGKIRRIIEDGFIEYKGAIDMHGKITEEDAACVHAIIDYTFKPEKGKEPVGKSKSE